MITGNKIFDEFVDVPLDDERRKKDHNPPVVGPTPYGFAIKAVKCVDFDEVIAAFAKDNPEEEHFMRLSAHSGLPYALMWVVLTDTKGPVTDEEREAERKRYEEVYQAETARLKARIAKPRGITP